MALGTGYALFGRGAGSAPDGSGPLSANDLLTALDALLKLAAVLALAYLCLALLQRYARQVEPAAAIRLLQAAHLAPNRSLHLIEIEGRRLLLGATPGQITVLAEWPAESVPRADVARDAPPTSAAEDRPPPDRPAGSDAERPERAGHPADPGRGAARHEDTDGPPDRTTRPAERPFADLLAAELDAAPADGRGSAPVRPLAPSVGRTAALLAQLRSELAAAREAERARRASRPLPLAFWRRRGPSG